MERALRAEELPASSGHSLRIGIDGGCLSNRRGFGRFARELVQALARTAHSHRLIVFVDRPSLDSGAVSLPQGLEVRPVAVRVAPSQAASSDGRRTREA